MKNILMMCLICISLSACAGDLITKSLFVEESKFNPALPRAVVMREVEWKVYNKKTLKKLIEKADKNNEDLGIITLSAEEYADLMKNYQDIIRNYSQLKSLIIYYRTE